MKPIWLTSYPRSGNTLVRTILYQCFNLKTGSVYSNDLGGNINLENYVGHIEFGQGEETIGILGHVDVVPEGNGWDYPTYVLRSGAFLAGAFLFSQKSAPFHKKCIC